MAGWIIHLRIAENLLNEIDGLDVEAFAIGNIAPDSGLPRPDGQGFDPPKQQSHYQKAEPYGEYYLCGDALFYNAFLKDVASVPSDPTYSFLLGYWFHLITDNLWIFDVWRPIKRDYFDDQFPSAAAIDDIKEDWHKHDLHYARTHPDSLYWRHFLQCHYRHDLFNHMPKVGIQATSARIKRIYREENEATRVLLASPDRYLTTEQTDKFVKDATATLIAIYRLILQADHEKELTDLRSGLQLLLSTSHGGNRI